jgi:hypothetical protein
VTIANENATPMNRNRNARGNPGALRLLVIGDPPCVAALPSLRHL